MPTYQYACTDPACGNRFELVQSFTDPSVTECPVCSGLVRKVYGSVGVVFKGSGFYRNDSRAGGANGSDSKAEPKADSKPTSESKSDAKSDSKSESKSESKSTSTSSDSGRSGSSSGSKAAASA